MSIKNWLDKEGIINFSNSWHGKLNNTFSLKLWTIYVESNVHWNHEMCFAGTKAVAAAMKKPAHGPVKDIGYRELSDKGLDWMLYYVRMAEH